MPTSDALLAMLPEHLLLVGILLLLVIETFAKGSRTGMWVALCLIGAASASAFWLAQSGFSASPFTGQYAVTPAILMAKGALLALALPVLLMSRTEFSDGEFSMLLMSSLYGLCLLPSADSYLVMFIGIELLAMPVYALVVLSFRRAAAAEASLKYLVLSGAASAMSRPAASPRGCGGGAA